MQSRQFNLPCQLSVGRAFANGCAAALVAVGMLLGARAEAATATTTFNVTATVLNVCAITAGDLAFGNYSATAGSPTDASSTISVTCTSGTPYTLALDAGLGSGATVVNRSMTSSGNTLGYALYTNAGRTTIWGDGTSSTSTVAGTGAGSAQSHTVYGRVAAGQYVHAGSYADTVTVTVTY